MENSNQLHTNNVCTYYVCVMLRKTTFIVHIINIKLEVDQVVSSQYVHVVNIKKWKIKYLLSSRNRETSYCSVIQRVDTLGALLFSLTNFFCLFVQGTACTGFKLHNFSYNWS